MAGTGAQAVVAALDALGVEVVFGLPGVHNLAVFRALAGSGIRVIGVRHEQAAGYAADGYARASGRLGVALVTTGPGAANALTATGEAMASGSPVLVIATDIPSTLRRPGVYRGVLHETRDQAAMFAPVTKLARTVADAAAIGPAVLAAGHDAQRAPSGPVYVGVPTDLLAAAAGPLAAAAPEPAAALRSPADLRAAAELLTQARRPLIWAGGGASRADAGAAVAALAQRLGAPVLTTYASRGLLAPEHPCAVPGPVHAPAVGRLWDEADLVVVIGSDLDAMMTQNWLMPAPPRLLAINVDPADAAKNYPPDLSLTGDAREVTVALVAALPAHRGPGTGPEPAWDLAAVGREVRAAVAADEPQAAALLDVFDRVLPADAVVLADMCIPGYWLAGFRRVPAPRKLAYPVGWGTLGFAFPAAIGAAAAGCGPVICVCGDGGFLFACGELATLAQEGLGVTVVLVDDGGYGMLRFDQEQAGDPPFGVDLTSPDFGALAGAFGVTAETVDGFGPAFERALAAAVADPAPTLTVVRARLKPPPTTSPRWYRRGAPTTTPAEDDG